MPQATEQYVQVLRVSVARVSLKGRTAAACAVPDSPNPSMPMPDMAMPRPVNLMNSRRVSAIGVLRGNLARSAAPGEAGYIARQAPSRGCPAPRICNEKGITRGRRNGQAGGGMVVQP